MKRLVGYCMVLLIATAMLGQEGSANSAVSNPALANGSAADQQKSDGIGEQLQLLRQELQQQQQKIIELEQQLLKQQASQQPRVQPPTLGQVASTPVLPAEKTKAVEVSTAQGASQPQPQSLPTTINLAGGKIGIGAVGYADWSIYPKSGFGPAFLDTPSVYPGPGNDGYNSFNVTRTYLNFLFSPTDWVTFRITPDIYRDIGSPAAQKLGATSGVASSPNGSLNLRLKYGYAQFQKIFSGAFSQDNIRFGQQTNPLIDWEEALYDYRFTSLVPWNFISLSSTYTGVSVNGPIMKNGKQYIDYQIGIFNNSNFHQFELAETKTFMARASLYPKGATSRFQGLGLTGFIDYGYNNAAPDTNSKTPVVRVAALAHYQSAHNGGQITFEYDYGRNAFSTGNLFGGSAPLDLVGLGPTQYAGMSALSTAILAGRSTKQQGYDLFGHINIPKSKWALFGLYQFFQPNTNVADNPLDFHRIVGGLAYRVNKNVRLAFDSQDVLYDRSNTVYPASSIATFNPSLAAANPAGIANPVPPSVQAFFVNLEFVF